MTKTKLILGAIGTSAACALICLPVLRGQRARETATASVQRTDKAPLQKRFHFLGDFERCSWVGGAVHVDSRSSVPSPPEFFIRAYVVLTPAQTKELLDRYEWRSRTET